MLQKKLELLRTSIAIKDTKDLIELSNILLALSKSSGEVLCVNERIWVTAVILTVYNLELLHNQDILKYSTYEDKYGKPYYMCTPTNLSSLLLELLQQDRFLEVDFVELVRF